ncbi:hypothetical protein FHR83_003633 [Actinoplanes campanulatus]|uniref:Abortive infection protein n=1 Tax=Actinoplanes campanulatus TaxID=113559 RepID=A0A7W5FEV7_9ACTN|nr:hypothetical protein [Actinoplanes campanulatus]MBB3095963.1 hypothetical protein [Actinoplanes campanulatus]GGN12738.1 hypothetical protein GCM10010109_23460 [Actinoplanes campanulatus]GID36942.1 hypothetical protein Aca09nite_34480 [Actinoplanes campanulatus]
MRVFGMNYDTGFVSAGSTTHEPFDPETVRRDLHVIRDELHCDAVRVSGGIQDRLELTARLAAEAGLEVWYCPFTNGLDRDQLMAFLLDGAERAERLRQAGAPVVYLTGSEIAMFTDGFLPGRDLPERMALFADPMRMREAIPAARAAVRDFLAEAVPAVRERFGGPIGYASIPLEDVDWSLFDIIASDAGYRDATNAAAFPQSLAAAVGQGKPYAATEFGCCTFRGAAAVAGASEPVTYDEHGRAAKLTAGLERDEQEQARYVMDLLHDYEAGGVEAAFVYTFANRHLPTTGDPAHDFDLAARGIVRVLPDGSWTPKAAFHALAAYGRGRRGLE